VKRTVRVYFLVLAGLLGLLSVFGLGRIKGESHFKNSLKKKGRVLETVE